MMTFLNPLVLTALLALPLLWFLLRVFPPVPRMIHLPSAWLLDGLVPTQQTTSKTPWWILLLRTIIAGLVILALARPVMNPADHLNFPGPIRIVMDNGWASAQTWRLQQNAAAQILDRAARDKREVYVLTTAADGGQTAPVQQGPMTVAQAETILRGLKPKPWPADYAATVQSIEKARPRNGVHTFWIAHGLNDSARDNGGVDLARALQSHGGLTVLEPEPMQRPLLLMPRMEPGKNPAVAITAARGLNAALPVSVEALGRDGRVIDQRNAVLEPASLPLRIEFDLPDTLRGQIYQIRLNAHAGAGGVMVLGGTLNRRTIGLVTEKAEGQTAPLSEASYYLTRALEPAHAVLPGTIEDLLKQKDLSTIILPDVGTLPPGTLQKLEAWTRRGGLLLRFAGPNMSESENFLTPTPLRRGERALSGSLSWDKAQGLSPFTAGSPLYGLDIPADLEVHQQILAEPVADMDKRVWAALADGTPLITAAPLDKGLVVLVHTTATPLWSNLALSGLFVQMLDRFVSLAGATDTLGATEGALHPLQVFDGEGILRVPDSTAQPIDATRFDEQKPDSRHPPGLYGRAGIAKTLNIGERITTIQPLPPLPAGVERQVFSGTAETDLTMLFLLGAFVLFLCDWLLMIVIQAFGTGRLRFSSAMVIMIAAIGLTLHSPGVQAQTPQQAVAYAAAIHLAFIQSGNPEVDDITRRGLESLSAVLADRTSAEPAGVVGLNPARDDLSFFPLIYWPITVQQTALGQDALQNIQFYLDHGGTILFDTRDNGVGGTTRNALTLRNITAGLDVAPLVQAPEDHVLTRSFYLLKTFPGRYDNNNLWIEEQSATGRDGVSSVIVGGNDWAAAWAGISPAPDTMEHEMAMRFGVNLMMYALTGNYKADQVHVPHILERLGR